jgi:hypothetical protein
MDVHEDEGRIDSRIQIPKLTMTNWSTEFKDRFKDLALNYGDAGDIIITGVENRPVRPNQELVIEGVRFYPNNDAGRKRFEKDEQQWLKTRDNKKKLMSKLFLHMDKEIREKIQNAEGYNDAYEQFDLLRIWQMTEQVVIGRGAISIYAITAKLVKLKQTGDYTRYTKEFKDLVHDLRNQGNAEEVLNRMIDTMFILGLNQEQFKEKLTVVYGRRDWPNIDDFSAELHMYVEATDRLKSINNNKDDDNAIKDGLISANFTNPGSYNSNNNKRNCYNCGGRDHIKPECKKPAHVCTICGKLGHIEKFCFSGKKDGNQSRPVQSNSKYDNSNKYNNNNNTNRRRDTNKQGIDNNKEMKGKSNKSRRRIMEIKKARAYIAKLENTVDYSDDENYDEFSDLLNNEDDDYEGDNNVKDEEGYLSRIQDKGEEDDEERDIVESEGVTTALLSSSLKNSDDDEVFIIDTGCKQANICRNPELLSEAREYTGAAVRGIT